MIDAIAKLGKFIRNRENLSGVDIFVENEQFLNNKPLIARINLEQKGMNIVLKDITHDEYKDDSGSYKKLLYRKPKSSGAGFSPSIIYQNIQKTLVKKILPIFAGNYDFLSDQENELLNKIAKCLQENLPIIEEKVEEINQIDKNQKIILTVIINDKYPYELRYISDIFLNKCESDLGGIYPNQVCSCCSENKVVYDRAFPFKFFTTDKLGYVYDLNQKYVYKMLPLCKDCAINLKVGRKYLMQHLQYNFYSMGYLLVPNFLNEVEQITLSKISDQNTFSTKKSMRDTQKGEEELIFREINKNLQNSLSFTLMFFDNKRQFLIQRVIEDVFPSRFVKIFEHIDVINKIPQLQLLFQKMPNLKFSFGTIRFFFPKNKSKTDDKFMDIVSNILLDKKTDYGFLAKSCLNKIIEYYNNKKRFELTTIQALIFIKFLQDFDLLKNFPGGDIMENKITGKKADKINKFLEQNKNFYNTNEKIACFLIGVLANEVLLAQKPRLGATPFIKQLKGFQMNFRDLKNLHNKTTEKMEQYDILKYNPDLMAEIAQYFSATESEWKLSNIDINFYVLQGLSLANTIIFDKSKTEADKNE